MVERLLSISPTADPTVGFNLLYLVAAGLMLVAAATYGRRAFSLMARGVASMTVAVLATGAAFGLVLIALLRGL
jgi:hypothetical protein